MNKTILRIAGAMVVGTFAFIAAGFSETARLCIGLIIGIPSVFMMITARVHLGKSFSVAAMAKKLVTGGLYSRIEHPLYLFLDLTLISIIIIFQWTLLLWIWAVLVTIQNIQARREEKILANAFGIEYETYRKSTWI